MHLLLSNNSRTRQYYYSCIIKLHVAECTDIRSPCWLPVKFWLLYHHTIGFSQNYVISIFHWLISWFILWLRYWFLIKSIIVQPGIEAKRGIASKNIFIASILYLKWFHYLIFVDPAIPAVHGIIIQATPSKTMAKMNHFCESRLCCISKISLT